MPSILSLQTWPLVADQDMPVRAEAGEQKHLAVTAFFGLVRASRVARLSRLPGQAVEHVEIHGAGRTSLAAGDSRIAAPALGLENREGEYKVRIAPARIRNEAAVPVEQQCFQAIVVEIPLGNGVHVVLWPESGESKGGVWLSPDGLCRARQETRDFVGVGLNGSIFMLITISVPRSQLLKIYIG
jgi:hypothetical protein